MYKLRYAKRPFSSIVIQSNADKPSTLKPNSFGMPSTTKLVLFFNSRENIFHF